MLCRASLYSVVQSMNWLIEKDPDAGKGLKKEEKGTTEDEMVGWHHQLNGYEFEQAPGVGDGQGSLACWSPWVAKSRTWLSDWTELNCDTSTQEECLLEKYFITVVCSLFALLDCLTGGSDNKESTCNAGDPGLILRLGKAWQLQSMGSKSIRYNWMN